MKNGHGHGHARSRSRQTAYLDGYKRKQIMGFRLGVSVGFTSPLTV
jgi:hypothetical protein